MLYMRTQEVFDWLKCLLLLMLMLLQVLALTSESWTTHSTGFYGQHPSLGVYKISGYNDEPYSDRSLVCVRQGRRFNLLSVNEALELPRSVVEDTTGAAAHGYRVVKRSGMVLDTTSRQLFTQTCNLLNATLQYMFSVCHTLGYTSPTQDNLRIVDDVNSNVFKRINNSLPVIIMPYWDNDLVARYAIPGWKGDACMFRLEGLYQGDTGADVLALMRAVNRTVRESKTAEWLRRPGGKWRNGWYEDTQGMRWSSDVMSTNPMNADGIGARLFDTVGERELNCIKTEECMSPPKANRWGSNLLISTHYSLATVVAISNGNRFGLFMFDFDWTVVITCVRDIATILSSMSLFWVLLRWILSMVALRRGHHKGLASRHNVSVGCISNAQSFNSLPLTMLPRLEMLLTVFFTAGCEIEGDQNALTASWFVMYPCIVEFVLLYCSILNVIARIFRRRMGSSFVIPTIVALGGMHWLRSDIGASKLFGYGGRVSTIVTSKELDSLGLVDFFTTDVALRLNGNIKSLYLIKLSLLAINLIPLVLSRNMTRSSKLSRNHRSCGAEHALSVRACNIGGYGLSTMYETATATDPTGVQKKIQVLSAYELVRLGYVVVGGRFLMDWSNWSKLVWMTSLRLLGSGRNHRVLVFHVEATHDCRSARISSKPQHLNAYDPQLINLKWWDIDARSLR